MISVYSESVLRQNLQKEEPIYFPIQLFSVAKIL